MQRLESVGLTLPFPSSATNRRSRPNCLGVGGSVGGGKVIVVSGVAVVVVEMFVVLLLSVCRVLVWKPAERKLRAPQILR